VQVDGVRHHGGADDADGEVDGRTAGEAGHERAAQRL
jgi:hypothetical protein